MLRKIFGERVTVFTVRILYKSGQTVDFDCTKFSIRGGVYEWERFSNIRPIQMGVDDIVAVWQINERIERVK